MTIVSMPVSISSVGRRVSPYSEWMVRPVFSSVSEVTFSSSLVPRMPCSGLNSETSVTPGAACSTSMVLRPARSRPVWLVTSPTRLPFSSAKPSRASTSMPARTGAEGVGAATVASGSAGVATGSAVRAASAAPSTIAAAAIVATRPRSDVDVTLAVGMEPAREKHHVAARRRDRSRCWCR